jgi:type IV pilus assembly protein PilC
MRSGNRRRLNLPAAAFGNGTVDEKAGTPASLCEPLVTIVLGALAGGLVIAMYLPIIQPGNVV